MCVCCVCFVYLFFLQAEDGIRDLVRSRGLGDVYKRQVVPAIVKAAAQFYAKLGVPEANIKFVDSVAAGHAFVTETEGSSCERSGEPYVVCLLYTSDAADERSSVDLGGRRIIKKKKNEMKR